MEKKNSYIISYRTKLENICWKSFYEHKNHYEEDHMYKGELKKTLIKKALETIYNGLKYNTTGDIYIFMKPEITIPFSDILYIEDI